MAISSCLKMQVNNKPPQIYHFRDNQFDFAVNAVEGSNVEDLIVLSHLYPFFEGFSEWFYVLPAVQQTGEIGNAIVIGLLTDSESSFVQNHPSSSLSLTGFTKQLLDDLVTKGTADPALPNPTFTVINERTILRIMRCTQSDIDSLLKHSDYPDYVDAFDLVKARLTNTVDVLNSTGLAPAVYYPDSDYIEFVAEGAVEYPRSSLPS